MDDQEQPQTDALQEQVEMTLDRLLGGDRTAALFLGLLVAKVLKRDRTAVLTVDALGRVCLMPPSAIEILKPYKIPDEELDSLPEDAAIQIMVAQGDTESRIIDYLAKRPK